MVFWLLKYFKLSTSKEYIYPIFVYSLLKIPNIILNFINKNKHSLSGISVASSIFTITAMAIDRYLAITRPFGFFHRSFNKTTTIVVIVLIWFSSMALFYPFIDMVVYESIEIPNITYVTYTICVEAENSPHKQTMGIIWFVFMFVIPGN